MFIKYTLKLAGLVRLMFKGPQGMSLAGNAAPTASAAATSAATAAAAVAVVSCYSAHFF